MYLALVVDNATCVCNLDTQMTGHPAWNTIQRICDLAILGSNGARFLFHLPESQHHSSTQIPCLGQA
jgi:hypothetical protein